jgi:hypothetical protein
MLIDKINLAIKTLKLIRAEVTAPHMRKNLSDEDYCDTTDEFLEREIDRVVQIYCAHEIQSEIERTCGDN